MRIGVLILPTERWSQARHTWQWVDGLGFAHAWTYDHVAWRDLVGQRWYAAVPTLAAAAGCTRRILLGTLVSSPNFRHPVPFAKEAVTLADVCDGRFVLGVGAGAGGSDAEVLGEPPWSPTERRDRFAEFVAATDRLLDARGLDLDGRYYSARRAWISPDGDDRAGIPLMVAGTGPTAMRSAARFGNGWVTNGYSPSPGTTAPAAGSRQVREQVERLHEVCAENGRDPGSVDVLLLNVNRDSPPLASVEAFVDAVGTYAALGVTDMVVPFPRREPPFVGDPAVLERIAADVLPGLTDPPRAGRRGHNRGG